MQTYFFFLCTFETFSISFHHFIAILSNECGVIARNFIEHKHTSHAHYHEHQQIVLCFCAPHIVTLYIFSQMDNTIVDYGMLPDEKKKENKITTTTNRYDTSRTCH